MGIALVHSAYYTHLLTLIDAVAEDTSEQTIAALIAAFVQRTARLAVVMRHILSCAPSVTQAGLGPIQIVAAQ